MANIFFAWELGSNLGHLLSIWPLAAELHRRGHRITLAIKDLARFAQINNSLPFTILQSPLFFPPIHTLYEGVGYCDILATAGYSSESSLLPLVLGWRQLYELSRPDIIVCQNAPTALLAACSQERFAVAMGSGFMCPPATTPMPGFGELGDDQRKLLTQTEEAITVVCNKVLQKFSARKMNRFADLLTGADPILCINPELDHYESRPESEYFGPLYADTNTSPLLFPKRFKKNILVYLNDFRIWKNISAAFGGLEANIVCAAVGLPEQEAKRACLPHVNTTNRAIPLTAAYDWSDLIICHGGPGVVAGALAAGKPVLLLPTQKEQWMLAMRIARQRYGTHLNLDASAGEISSVIKYLLSDGFDRAAIYSYASKYKMSTLEERIHRITEKILEQN